MSKEIDQNYKKPYVKPFKMTFVATKVYCVWIRIEVNSWILIHTETNADPNHC